MCQKLDLHSSSFIAYLYYIFLLFPLLFLCFSFYCIFLPFSIQFLIAFHLFSLFVFLYLFLSLFFRLLRALQPTPTCLGLKGLVVVVAIQVYFFLNFLKFLGKSLSSHAISSRRPFRLLDDSAYCYERHTFCLLFWFNTKNSFQMFIQSFFFVDRKLLIILFPGFEDSFLLQLQTIGCGSTGWQHWPSKWQCTCL